MRVPYKYGEKVDHQDKTRDYALCPEPLCGLHSQRVCKCPCANSECPNGHEWHIGSGDIVTRGKSH